MVLYEYFQRVFSVKYGALYILCVYMKFTEFI